MNKFDVVIVAGGKSERFKKDKLRQILSNGESVLKTTISKFLNIDNIGKIIVVRSNDDKVTIIDKKDKGKVIFCNGGNTRAESVINGTILSNAEYVLIHDGARPFVSIDLIESLMKECTNNIDIVIPILKISDSLKFIKSGIISVNRDDYILTQTPQIIRKKIFDTIYKKETTKNWQDELELYLKYYSDNRVKFVNGETTNKKITYPKDL